MAPYLSVVVTTRNDDHGGDPLKRLQALVNSFDEQCRRTGLEAEVVVVEWNPPSEKPRVSELLRLPPAPACDYRFIDVPAQLHEQLAFADVLPLFQMIAKNVGIRRARGDFVLATNIDIILSNELVEFIALKQLTRGVLYRVDRHDVASDLPVWGSLEQQITYCATHHLRLHTRWGSFQVDSLGAHVTYSEDIVDGHGVRLGAGWHVRESVGPQRPFRWASDSVSVTVDPAAAGLTGDVVLDLDLESNPYDAASWVDVVVHDGAAILKTARISGRMRLAVPLGPVVRPGRREIRMSVKDGHPESRRQLPVFERRDAMWYRVHSATLTLASVGSARGFAYPLERWRNAYPHSRLVINAGSDRVEVASDPRRWSYCLRYGPIRVPRRGTYRFKIACTVLEGRVAVGVLSNGDQYWIPSTVMRQEQEAVSVFDIAVDLPSHEECSIVISNDHPDGTGVTRFIVHEMSGTCDPQQALVEVATGTRAGALRRRRGVAYAKLAARTRAVRNAWSRASSREQATGWKSRTADAIARTVGRLVGSSIRYRIARSSPEYENLEQALRASDEQVRKLSRLQDLSDLQKFLRDSRPNNLHVNGCGDFQLMAREHWEELRGYPEFETFSMNIDGLFSYIADAAGIRERVLPMPIYHLEHEVGSGWSPEGEAALRKRIAERGITWVDASTVYIWAAYMWWLGRPMIFNGAGWGLDSATLVERHVPRVPS